ncbi:MAG: multiheme c-type cytochrome [Acidobacteriota bacterium]
MRDKTDAGPRRDDEKTTQKPRRQRYVPVVGPRLHRLLAVVLGLFAVLVVNAVYLASVTIAGPRYQNWFYLVMFGLHLVLGLLLVVPVVAFGAIHIRNARNRPNRRAIRAGYALFTVALLLLVTGIVLMRVDVAGLRLEVNQPLARSTAYWIHVLSPLAVIWLFVLHRLAGRRIRWRTGLAWAGVAAAFAGGMLLLHSQDPRSWNVAGPESGEQYFFPSLARTSTGNFIPARVLANDAYCQECHADVHEGWAQSVHRFSSFNNPPYEFSVKNTRRTLMARDGDVHGSRFCAGCHDPVPFFSGAFDDPKFDDPDYDLAGDPMAQAGITCTVCHSIGHVNSVKGNADYTIDEPVHYPFAFSDNPLLRWVNRQLVKAKPEFHKATFLKPLHRSTEFCGTCHKVHLPPELNSYKWLRGQDHYDAFWLSGVSGHGITSFYYPPKAEPNCNGCHMPLFEVSDAPNFSARVRDDSGLVKTLDHQFPSANTAIPFLVRDRMPDADAAIEAHRKFNEGVMRVDIFGVKEDGRIDGRLIAPVRPEIPVLQPGRTYLLEVVIRTLKMGHLFTQGTADSNEVWLEVAATSGERVVGRSGFLDPADNAVDPWAHFVNAFVIDREGNRIDRRNAEDIFIALYNHQIPPGAADVVHYRLDVPADLQGPIAVDVRLRYRKFDTRYMRLVTGDEAYYNDLPILTLAEDHVTFPVAAGDGVTPNRDSPIEPWQRWNDYGIGLLRKGQLGELRQAAEAFTRVEELGRPDGPINLARVYIKEGLVQTHAQDALRRAAAFTPAANEWSLLWFAAQVAQANGDYDLAITNLEEILQGGFAQAEGRDFDFSKDYRVLDALGNALYQRGLQERGEGRRGYMERARDRFLEALTYDPENLTAHWGLKQVYRVLGDPEQERVHTELHARYKPDDNARDYAVAQARLKYPASNKAAEAVVIYDLRRDADQPGIVEVARNDD